MKTFENVSSLKDATLRAGQLVETKGYYSPGDGGGGRYLIQDTATPDEYVDHTLAGGTYAVLQYNGALNIKQAGAKGDGATDDSGAINACMNKPTKYVYIPKSDYYIQNDIFITSNIHLQGDGDRSKLLIDSTGNALRSSVICIGQTDIIIEKIQIGEDFASTRTAGSALLDFIGCSNINVNNVTVNGASGMGLRFEDSSKIVVNECSIHDTYADGLHIRYGCTDVVVECNDIYDCGDDCIGVISHDEDYLYGRNKNVVISNNILHDHKTLGAFALGSGVGCSGSAHVIIESNIIYNTASASIRVRHLDQAEYGGIGFYVGIDVKINNNVLRNPGLSTIGGQLNSCIDVVNSRDITISNNYMYNPLDFGVWLHGSWININIHDNDIVNCSVAGGRGVIVQATEKAGDYLLLWTDSEGTTGRVETYVYGHNLYISNNSIDSTGLDGILVQGSSARRIEHVELRANKVSRANLDAGSARGIFLNYVDTYCMNGNTSCLPANTLTNNIIAVNSTNLLVVDV